MIRVAFLCLQIAILAFAGVWLANEPGMVTIIWREWRVDVQIGIFVLLLGCLIAMAVTVFLSWQILRHGPKRLLSSHRLGRERKGYRELTQGMISLASGEAVEALRHAHKANSLLNEPTAGHLLIAEAAKLQGKMVLAKEHYEAMSKSAGAAVAGLRGLFEQAVSEGDSATALELGTRIRELKQDPIWLLPRLFHLKVGARDWEGADEVLLDAMRRKAIPAEGGRRDRAFVLFERGQSALCNGDLEAAIGFMREANDLNSGFEAAAIEYARLLGAEGKKRRALRVLEQAWSRGGAFKSIAEEYIRLQQVEDPVEEYKLIQKLSTMGKNDPDALLILSDFALKARLWGEARRQLKALLQDKPTASAYTLLAELEDAENDDTAAAEKWRRMGGVAADDKIWICASCNAQSTEWKSCCDNCGSFGDLEWRLPNSVPSLPHLDNQRTIQLLEKPEG